MADIGGWILGKVGAKAAKKVLDEAIDRVQAYRVRSKANEGKDLTKEGTFRTLVQSELRQLAEKPSLLPTALQDSTISSWIGADEFLEPFIWLLISSGDGHIHLDGPAYKFLEEQYELATGQTKKLASGPVALFASHVIGRLQQGDRKQRLNLALSKLLAAGFQSFFHQELRGAPTRFDIFRLRSFADNLVTTGRSRWKMPSFIAPFKLELRKREHKNSEGDEEKTVPSSEDLLVDEILRGGKIVLAGEGGIGKTTLLLDLAAKASKRENSRVAIFVDAAVWANSGRTIFEYLESHPSAVLMNLSASTLAWLTENGRVALMINGWNEIPPSRRDQCQSNLDHLISALPDVAVVVSSRLSSDAGNIENAIEIDVRGISWKGQREVISTELDEAKAKLLIEQLSKTPKLQRVARSPLILRGLMAQARSGVAGSKAIFDALEAVVNEVEEHAQKQGHFSAAPVSGLQKYYLEELAIELSRNHTTYISRDEALQSFGKASARILSMLGAPVSLPSILEILSTHHLLHVQDKQVRFVHHRFQEYYCACSLKRICEGDDDVALLKEAINEPFWTDALSLVAEKYESSDGPSAARLKLVKTALEIDFPYGCDLIGESNFDETDSSEIFKNILDTIDELSMSSISEINTLAASCMIASRLPVFAPKLWEILEDENQQHRLGFHRTNSSSVSVKQLGPDTKARLFKWDLRRQKEFLHEIANNSDNFDFVLDVAKSAPVTSVRTEALAVLLFNYVNSIAAFNAWLEAPSDVQVERSILSTIRYLLEQEIEVTAIRGKINQLMRGASSSKGRVRLLIDFEGIITFFSIEDVLEWLENDINFDDWILYELAERHAPERLSEIAVDFALGELIPPGWVNSALRILSASSRASVFDKAMEIAQSPGYQLHSEAIGPLANYEQIYELARDWRDGRLAQRLGDVAYAADYIKFVEEILSFVDGDILLDVVVDLGLDAEYVSAADLIDLVRKRITDDASRYTNRKSWAPTGQQFKRLFERYKKYSEVSSNRSARLSIWLACIEAAVSGADSDVALENALDDYLDAWSSHRERILGWMEHPGRERPMNPPYGPYLSGAFASHSFRALPLLLARANHPCADVIVPSVLARIATSPWLPENGHWRSTISGAINEGNKRRKMGLAFKMPTVEHQREVDEVAAVLINALEAEQEKARNIRTLAGQENKVRQGSDILLYLRSLVIVPSELVRESVINAFKEESFEPWRVVDIIGGLLRQGYELDDGTVIRVVEEIYQKNANKNWYSDDEKNGIRNLIEIIISTPRLDLLSRPVSYYLEQWCQYAHPNSLVDFLGGVDDINGWELILEAYRIYSNEINTEELVSALSTVFRLEKLDSLIGLIESGQIFTWILSRLSHSEFAHTVAAGLQDSPNQLERLLDVLQRLSTADGDSFIAELLKSSEVPFTTMLKYGLAAADAGRAANPDEPGYQILESVLTERVDSDGYFDIYPRACAVLRSELYWRAKAAGSEVTFGARRMLAHIELVRREYGRPVDEPRHPLPEDGVSWTEVLT